jgi:hypothetical protein
MVKIILNFLHLWKTETELTPFTDSSDLSPYQFTWFQLTPAYPVSPRHRALKPRLMQDLFLSDHRTKL